MFRPLIDLFTTGTAQSQEGLRHTTGPDIRCMAGYIPICYQLNHRRMRLTNKGQKAANLKQ
jgi:hypothetical protein